MEPVSLSIRERFDLIKYTHRLPSTIKLRLAVDAFLNMLEVTDEESKKFDIKVDPLTFELTCNDDSYTVEYKDLPADVLNAIKDYIYSFDTEENLENIVLQKAFVVFKKVTGSK